MTVAVEKARRWDEILARLPPDTDLRGAEIGVWRALLSKRLIDARPRLHLVLVDPWRAGKPGTRWGDSGSEIAKNPQQVYEQIYNDIVWTWGKADNVTIHRTTSTKAAHLVEDASLDFVFIDGDHSEEAVTEDIRAWRPKVKPGGWIGGHDYGSNRFTGVQAAVLKIFDVEEVTVGADRTWFVTL